MAFSARARSILTANELIEIDAKIQKFFWGNKAIRTIDDNGQRWVVFADICKALGYKNPNHESKKVELEDKCKLEIGLKNTLAVCISKRGLYVFSLLSNKSEASDFRLWADREIFDRQGGG